jgi:hypothetical protein
MARRTCQEKLVAIVSSLSDLAIFDDWEDGEDMDDTETGQGQVSKDDKPGWVMGTITKMVQQHMERILHKHRKLDEITNPGWEHAAEYLCERDKTYSKSELNNPVFIQP